METHDPMCPWFGSGDPWAVGSTVHTCACDLIAKVRADEREHRTAEVAATGRWCREDERATMRAQVEALQVESSGGGVRSGALQDVLDVIDGSSDD